GTRTLPLASISAGPPPVWPTVARLPDPFAAPGPGPGVDPARPAPGSQIVPDESAPVTVIQREAAPHGAEPSGGGTNPASAPAAPGGPASAGDLDALAARLYDKIRYRL